MLTHVAAGLSNDEIVERLVISPATAKTHVSRIVLKLDARDRTQLVGHRLRERPRQGTRHAGAKPTRAPDETNSHAGTAAGTPGAIMLRIARARTARAALPSGSGLVREKACAQTCFLRLYLV